MGEQVLLLGIQEGPGRSSVLSGRVPGGAVGAAVRSLVYWFIKIDLLQAVLISILIQIQTDNH